MKSLKVSYLLVLATYVEVTVGNQWESLSNWNYIVFTQQWPETVCLAWKERSGVNACNFPQGLDSWTIHGIWPTKNAGNSPQFCNSSWAFNVTRIQSLLTNLEQHWPNIYKGTSEDEFWAHEWNKHGTCAAIDNLIQNEHGYFSAGLKMAQKYNITTMFDSAGIVPDQFKTYTMTSFESSVRSYFGVEPVVVCYKDKKNNRYLIKELRLCVDKNLDLINCTEAITKSVGLEDGCPASGTIYYQPVGTDSRVTYASHSEL